MLSREQKKDFRSNIFRHLDGIVVAPTAYTLKSKGILDHILKEKKVEVSELSKLFNANEGYLNVALRILASQGWLEQEIENKEDKVFYSINEKSNLAFQLSELYKDVNELIKFSASFHKRKFEREPFFMLESIIEKYKSNYGLRNVVTGSVEFQVLNHIEGLLVGPTIVALGMSGMFHKYFIESSFQASEFHEDSECFEKILDFFVWKGWFSKNNSNYTFTDTGLFFAKRASAYGVTVSYIPTLRNLDTLIFSDPNALRSSNVAEDEIHVDREMNVWGSGGAHTAYFKYMDKVLIEIFNQPIEDQPKGLLDMGCGNGAFLIHAYNVIESRTLRGELLDDYPLFLVGADYNKTALEITRNNIVKHDIWAKIIWGDIGKPEQLAEYLNENYQIDLSDLLNVRTFLDHNRIWEEIDEQEESVSSSSGAYAYRGRRISNNSLEQNLKQHFQNWFPFVEKHGLLLIELHTVNPDSVSKNIGNTPVTAYDGTHGYSDQYIIELDIFKQLVQDVGYNLVEEYSFKFPNSELASVSINLIKGNN